MEVSKAETRLFGYAVDYAMYVDMRMATTARGQWLTPYEMIKGVQPSITHLRPFYTKSAVKVPKSKRLELEKQGQCGARAEQGRFIGFHQPFSTTPKLLLSGNRVIHNINVTYNINDYSAKPITVPGDEQCENELRFRVEPGAAMTGDAKYTTLTGDAWLDNPLTEFQQPDQELEEHNRTPEPKPDYFEWNADESPEWTTRGRNESLRSRPRPSYMFVASVDRLAHLSPDQDEFDNQIDEAVQQFDKDTENPDVGAHLEASRLLALHSAKDMSWELALEGREKQKAISAFNKERASLEDTILDRIYPDDPRFETAVNEATPGRWLLDIKRDGRYKARGVKQGFRENWERADGPGFNYYAHVAKLETIRMTLFRHNRRNKRIAIKDIETAFLQSHKYENGQVKFICFKNPITGEWEYWEQSGPIYGEASAPARWQSTISPWIEEQGFIRAANVKCVC